jgi:hypothetical protein
MAVAGEPIQQSTKEVPVKVKSRKYRGPKKPVAKRRRYDFAVSSYLQAAQVCNHIEDCGCEVVCAFNMGAVGVVEGSPDPVPLMGILFRVTVNASGQVVQQLGTMQRPTAVKVSPIPASKAAKDASPEGTLPGQPAAEAAATPVPDYPNNACKDH